MLNTFFLPFMFFFLFAVCCSGQQNKDLLSTQLEAAIHSNQYSNIDGILIQVGSKIIYEQYFNGFKKDSLHDTRSSFKSITSLLAGIAIDQGLITLDEPIRSFFPELSTNKSGDISIQNLLEMRSGLNCEEFYGIGPDCESEMWETQDWIAYCLDLKQKHEPGLNWSYSSIPPMILGEVIKRASKMSIMDFAAAHLFTPLGIDNYRWTLSPKGRGMTGGSFYMRPIDMLKIIKLVKDKGLWQGKRIVSKAWIEKSTNCQENIDFSFTRYARTENARYESARYGYYWYKEHLHYGAIDTDLLFASGNGGQYMMYLKDYDALVVFTGSNYNNWRNKLPFEILLKFLIPMIGQD